MSHQETPARRHLMREKALFRYTSALERGDFETIAAVLHEAEADPELARLIAEVNDTMAADLGAASFQRASEPIAPVHQTRQPILRLSRALAFAAVIVVVVLGLGSLMFLQSRGGGMRTVGLIPTIAASAAVDQYAGQLTAAAESGVDAQALQEELATAAAALQQVEETPAPFPTATAPGTQPPMTQALEVTAIGGQDDGDTGERPVQPVEPMIVKNGEIEIVVADTNVAIERVTQVARDSGGYVLSNQAWSEGPYRSATMTIAVRVDQFETAMRRLRELAMEVVFESSSGQDVSSEYVDLQSRLRNLEATRDRIRSFLGEATTVEEALEINRQLAEIEAQIEQVQGRMQYLSGRAAFSTITITIQQNIDATATPTPTNTPTPTPTRTPTPTSPWSLGPRIENATRQQTAIFRGLLELLTWLIIVPGPYLLITGLIILAVRALRSRRPGP